MVTFTVAGCSSGVMALVFRVHERAVMLVQFRRGDVQRASGGSRPLNPCVPRKWLNGPMAKKPGQRALCLRRS